MIDLASPSAKDTLANLAPLSEKSTSPNKPVPPESADSKGSRLKNYDNKEDVNICNLWLNISQDPLNLTNQAADTFWKRVGERYESMRDDTLKFRTWSSVKLSNQSGVNAEDQFNNALKYYKATSEKNKKFSHIQCYYVLHEALKWKEHCAEWLQKQQEEKKKGKKSGSAGNSGIFDGTTIDFLASDPINDDTSSKTPSIKSKPKGRPPIGTRKAKDLLAKAREDNKFEEEILSAHRDLAQQTKNKTLSSQANKKPS
ncbi:hypothetical protein Pst134EA_011156 [Puccinia striiformis f. sp. tritici]|uniref:hypothetical protein n=1 Tax=Puccinia striiformis f. sp. tritici TaxID=168172 RepID=UPI0020079C83|nr:hypothetical protein Pst134EA_011156 [Puccinia striiformis f. sp. tritici]KAH9467515.1 hypothetical protein Pst134EA_011156 [Puccinia striiformis f. sp. tritici]